MIRKKVSDYNVMLLFKNFPVKKFEPFSNNKYASFFDLQPLSVLHPIRWDTFPVFDLRICSHLVHMFPIIYW